MTYKNWTKHELQVQIVTLFAVIEEAKKIMIRNGVKYQGQFLTWISIAEITLEELRKEYKLR